MMPTLFLFLLPILAFSAAQPIPYFENATTINVCTSEYTPSTLCYVPCDAQYSINDFCFLVLLQWYTVQTEIRLIIQG